MCNTGSYRKIFSFAIRYILCSLNRRVEVQFETLNKEVKDISLQTNYIGYQLKTLV